MTGEEKQITEENSSENPNKIRILVTGYDDYKSYQGGSDSELNISSMIAEQLDGFDTEDIQVDVLVIPVDYRETKRLFDEAVSNADYDYIISIGENNYKQDYGIEYIIEADDYYFGPDGKGKKPDLKQPNQKKCNSYVANSALEFDEFVETLACHDGIEANIARDARSYLCEYINYLSLQHMASKGKEGNATFFHVNDVVTGQLYDGLDQKYEKRYELNKEKLFGGIKNYFERKRYWRERGDLNEIVTSPEHIRDQRQLVSMYVPVFEDVVFKIASNLMEMESASDDNNPSINQQEKQEKGFIKN